MVRRIHKKAVMFSITVLLLLAIILIILLIQSRTTGKERQDVINTRVSALDHFVRDVRVDLERGARIVGHRAILAMTEHAANTGQYVTNTESSFVELFLNGTLNGESQALVQNETFTNWVSRVQDRASKINVDFTIDLERVTITQQDPWLVRVEIDSMIHVRDVNDLARWDTNKTVVAEIDIRGFEDPVYTVGTNGRWKNTINQSTMVSFVSGSDASNLLLHLNRSAYTAWTGAPSFLNRLAGNMSASPYGIESLVNIDRLIDVGAELRGSKSIVDYIYFGSTNPTVRSAPGLPSWALMDEQYNNASTETHWQKYEYDELVPS